MLFSKIAYAFSKRNNFPPGTIRFVIPDGEGGAKLQDDMTIENVRPPLAQEGEAAG
jgi:hypothetical protein